MELVVSADPEFAPKAADIIGLYLAPPQNALVISVDEKPGMQALERATGYVCASNSKIVHGLKSTYKRHGTLSLFAASNVATGAIHTQTTGLLSFWLSWTRCFQISLKVTRKKSM